MLADPPPVIVAPLDSYIGIQAARIFWERGIPVIGITPERRHPHRWSRAVERTIIGEATGDGFVDLLERMGPTFDRPPVIVPCHDDTVLALSAGRDRLAPWYRCVLPTDDTVRLLLDKELLHAHATSHGMAVPRSVIASSASEAKERLAVLPVPAVVKPALKNDLWRERARSKAVLVTSRAEMSSLLERLGPDYGSALVIQEWIAGAETDLHSAYVYAERETGRIALCFTARKIRQWPPLTGSTSLGQECRDDELCAIASDLFRSVGLVGLGYLECKIEAGTGRHVLIEAGVGRATGRSAIVEAGGVEWLLCLYNDALGLPLPAALVQRHTGVKWIHLLTDVRAAASAHRHGELTLGGWIASLRGPKVFALFRLRDPLPGVLTLVDLVLRRSQVGQRVLTRRRVRRAATPTG